MADTEKIRILNDGFRRTLCGGKVVATQGVSAMPDMFEVMQKVRGFSDFDKSNDPHHEHDFGAFKHDGHQIFFKIDYYDLDMSMGSPDPSDPSVTTRVLTVMLAEEY